MITHAITLAPDERIERIVRRHWYHLAVIGVVDIFILCASAVVVIALNQTVSEFSGVSGAELMLLSAFGLSAIGLLLWMHFFMAWSDHWLDAWVITNTRIIDIEQKGFFSRQVSSFPLTRIQDVTFDVHGIIATWLQFGDVRIQTASISNDFVMRQVPHPDVVKEYMMSALGR